MLPILQRAQSQANSMAIVDPNGSYSYESLVKVATAIASGLLGGDTDLGGKRVAFMVEPGFGYVSVQWGIWQAGGIAVPIALSYPIPSIAYILEDTAAEMVVSDLEHVDFLQPLAAQFPIRVLLTDDLSAHQVVEMPDVSAERPAMILYTSGTTSKPKGVVTTHQALEAQITTLTTSWHWSSDDYTVCVLPLHHVHGIVNVVACALWSGAVVEFLPKFTPESLFTLFSKGRVNVFMAVPTIYFKLIQALEALPVSEQAELRTCLKKFRLMVSGSAALPVSTLETWKSLSGHILLERYGMTEIGMAISNPYDGERRPGYIGVPLPGMQVRLVSEGKVIDGEQEAGEIQVKGPAVFKEYWNKPEATARSFTSAGWFRTGDVAVMENGYYRILGRESVDIIKSGGYKISALEIEELLRTYPEVADCCVVGIPDAEWGEVVGVALVEKGVGLDLEALKTWLRTQLPGYKTPRNYLRVAELPRNAMGKVTKNEVKKLFV